METRQCPNEGSFVCQVSGQGHQPPAQTEGGVCELKCSPGNVGPPLWTPTPDAAGRCLSLPTRKPGWGATSAARRGRNTRRLYAGRRVVTQAAGRRGQQPNQCRMSAASLVSFIPAELCSCRRDEEGRSSSFLEAAPPTQQSQSIILSSLRNPHLLVDGTIGENS